VLGNITEYEQNLQTPWPYSNSSLYDPSGSLGLNADHLVGEDLLKQALESNKLVVSPHGSLHLLPWGGLTFKSKRLFEHVPIGIVPNLSCVPSLMTRPSVSPKMALMSPPDYSLLEGLSNLPGAERECEQIEKLYDEKCRLVGKALHGDEVTEEGFWSFARMAESKDGILHMACHGIIDFEDPLHSGLLLSRTRIDASEIAMSSLPFDEVVLSACSTGWRPTHVKEVALSGDDILGLPGALLEAGVRSVLVSIPPADDEAGCAFMTRYHVHRLSGKSPLLALRATQMEMLREGLHDPAKWIGFTAYGCR
jgi:CHAT domain-containing protein